MPQVDRHRNRQVPIEFNVNQTLDVLPPKNRHAIVLISQGDGTVKLNNYPLTLKEHSVICLKETDQIEISEQENLVITTFTFDPIFLNTVRLSQTKDINVPNTPKIKEGLSLFENNSQHHGFIELGSQVYPKFLQWFLTLGMEIQAQSDELWVCRIKQYLIKIFNLLKELELDQQHSPIEKALQYIHLNYTNPIHVEDLTELTHLNRVSLNDQFKQRVNQTALQYLLSYRLNLAEQMLTHTGMTLNDIALATGFEYDTYFMKQFKQHQGMSPTQYRNITRKIASVQ